MYVVGFSFLLNVFFWNFKVHCGVVKTSQIDRIVMF